ncbi:MAG: C25 family cysteine peptidase [Candidatus Cloacimonetes bacterium]|nr:C25 family cysteine peptidase [Candidatus Cloacimonadota bacterium]
MRRFIMLLILLLSISLYLNAETVDIADYANGIKLIQSSSNEMILEMTLGSFTREAVSINNQTWYNISTPKSGLTLEEGFPQVPILAGSLIIPANAHMEQEVLESEYHDIEMRIAPSKGSLSRNVNPETVPYSFNDFYNGTDIYPTQNIELSEPFILRDYRGITIRFKPIEYHPYTATTRVYTRIRVRISQNGNSYTNALNSSKGSYSREFEGIYKNMFLNFGQAKYPALNEDGRILVINNSMFNETIQPWVDWKRQNGYDVTVVDVQEAGPTANQIKAYIQTQYNLNNGLMFLQIMGDSQQVPSLLYAGGGSDPSFALLAGNDSYPDIFVGRFSAQTVAEMQTQIQRSIEYERDMQSDATWIQKAIGIASNEGGGYQGDNGESDQQHMDLIRTDLLNYGYDSVDQLYAANGATASQVSSNLNIGRGFINYVGHGSDTSWVTTGFNVNNVNALTNNNMLPFIVSVACVNGNFVNRTCFAEAWMRATNNGTPTGAVAIYASSVNQDWNPPMRGQDEITDLLIAEAKTTIGGLFFNGSSKMIEVYGSQGSDEYKNWHIFGDASLMVRTKNPTETLAEYNPVLLIGMDNLIVTTEPNSRVTLSGPDNAIYAKTVADGSGTAILNLDIMPDQPMDLSLTITAFNKTAYIGTIEVLPAAGAYIVINDVSIEDGNDNLASFNEIVTVHVEIENLGSDPAEDLSLFINTTDPHLSVVGNPEIITVIEPNSTASTVLGIDVKISDSVPDQYLASFNVEASLSDGTIFSYEHSITINAPDIEWGTIQIDDASGNDNGRVDPGESFVISIPFINQGHAPSPEIFASLSVFGGENMISPITETVSALEIGEEGNALFMIHLSSQIEPGSTIRFDVMASYANTILTNSYSIVAGILLENFEAGLTNFPWTFNNGDWSIASGGYNNSMAARSAQINHNQSTSISITLNNPIDGFVSFWKKVSSEQNGDYLNFYINGMLKNQWSGISEEWQQVSYIVMAGTNTYRWEYVKDGSVSSGSDCVWIDEILFPAESTDTGSPLAIVDVTELDFGNTEVGEESILPVTITNNGNAVMLGTIQISTPFSLITEDLNILADTEFALNPDDSKTFEIAFLPLSHGTFNTNLVIVSDDPLNSQIIIPVTGESNPSANENNVNPIVTELKGNYPNPFNPNTTISFSIKNREFVSVDIYNILGQRVKTLINSDLAPGMHSVTWNGKDDNNRNVASGIYFYKMKSGKYTSTKKMILMK